MKRIFCIFIAAALLFGASSCAPKGVDVFAEALALTDFGASLEGMPFMALGAGIFQDYKTVHANPTKIADMPLDITAMSKVVSKNTDGLSEFLKNAAKSYGFKNDFDVSKYDVADSLDGALELIFAVTGSTEGLSEAKASVTAVSDELRPALAKYLSKAAKAYSLYYSAAKSVSDDNYSKLQSYRFCAPATSNPEPLANAYRVSSQVSELVRIAAGLLITEAASELVIALQSVSALTVNGNALTVDTPAGKIILGSASDDVYSSPDAFLLIDIAGNDSYNGRVAASMAKNKPVSVVIDLNGDDIYDSKEEKVPSQGAGIVGAGLLFDMGGNDSYSAARASQGFALLGVGVLFDAGGDDEYSSEVSSQSSGYFGISVLADIEGNDSYYAYGYAQASAGCRAMSFLVDKKGNDKYFVETYVQPGYSDMYYGQFQAKVNGNWSQGCGMGNRSVSTSANGLSGGIAGLIDLGGDDRYTGCLWVQGTGYWSGYGFLTDIGGNDIYNSRYYSHASVAHYGAAALIDIGGDDKHLVQYKEESIGEGASLAFVWDRGVALLADDGGNDKYDSMYYSIASSWSEYDDRGEALQDMSYAFFIETEGNDEYPTMASQSFGWGRGGFFFDLKGEDKYRDKSYYDGLTRTDTAGVFIDSENGYVSFWKEAREKSGM